MTIALDGMGGDNAPRAPVEAAARLSRESNVRVLLVGRQDELKAELGRFEHRADRIELRHASETIGMADKPRQALDERPDASVSVACRAVAEGAADAVVSAGSTGALVLAAARSMPLVEGVKRAALAVYPTAAGSSNNRFARSSTRPTPCPPSSWFILVHGHAMPGHLVYKPSIAAQLGAEDQGDGRYHREPAARGARLTSRNVEATNARGVPRPSASASWKRGAEDSEGMVGDHEELGHTPSEQLPCASAHGLTPASSR